MAKDRQITGLRWDRLFRSAEWSSGCPRCWLRFFGGVPRTTGERAAGSGRGLRRGPSVKAVDVEVPK